MEGLEDQWENCYWSQEEKNRAEDAKLSARLETSKTIHKGMCSQDITIVQTFSNISVILLPKSRLPVCKRSIYIGEMPVIPEIGVVFDLADS